MAKRQEFLLSFCQSTLKRQRESEEKAVMIKNQMTLIAKMYRLKITKINRLKIAQKNLNMNLNIHVMIHRI